MRSGRGYESFAQSLKLEGTRDLVHYDRRVRGALPPPLNEIASVKPAGGKPPKSLERLDICNSMADNHSSDCH